MKKLINRLILGLAILLATGLLIAYIAPFINPSTFFLPALFGLAYPYILLLNLLMMFYFMIRLKKAFFLSLIVILLGWSHLNNLIPLHLKKSTPPPDSTIKEEIRVISYNVRAFNIYNWSKETNARGEILKFLNTQSPDIICLQEYFISNDPGTREQDIDRILGKFPYKSVYYSHVRGQISSWGVATYSMYPIVKRSRIPFSNSKNAAMYTDMKVGDDTLRVFNVHLQSIQFRERNYAFIDSLRLKYSDEQLAEFRDIGSHLKQAYIRRAEQADVIANYIKQSPYPVILMGDFNDTPVSYTYRKINRILTDSFRASGKGFGNTYAGELPSFRIDFIFYSEPLFASDFRRIRIKFSDHYPVQSTLYLTGQSD